MPADWERRLLHYGPDAVTLRGEIATRAIVGCWFELHRQGGCGAGELRLWDRFPERNAIDVGDWIACDVSDDDRWYFGRVEARDADSPAGIRYRLEGAAVELGEVFPGGFGPEADGVPPHRYARTDLFPNDPDRLLETFDPIDTTTDLVRLLIQQYVAPSTHIVYDPDLVIEPPLDASLSSFKFRGEESIRSVLKDLAFRARHASWGVDATRAFFFRPKFDALQGIVQEAVDISRLEESRDREMLFNRVTLTGDYVYGDPVDSSGGYRSFFRWRGNYTQPESRQIHGERRIRLWIPWIRSNADARGFVREFFRVYAQPTTKYLVDLPNRHTLIRPWAGRVRLLDRTGQLLIETHVESVRVQFDHAPRFRLELGPEDPRTLWPEPPHDERWETPQQGRGGDVTVTDSTEEETEEISSSAELSDDPSSTAIDPTDDASSDAQTGTSEPLSESLPATMETNSSAPDVTDETPPSGESSLIDPDPTSETPATSETPTEDETESVALTSGETDPPDSDFPGTWTSEAGGGFSTWW